MDMSYGQRLRQERIRNALSVRSLAQRIGCDKSSIVDWEQDKRLPTPVYQATLAKCLGGSLRDERFLATPEHLALRPKSIAEQAWVKELQSLFEQQLMACNNLTSRTGDQPPDREEKAAILARQIQLWAHDVVPNPFGRGVHYRLVADEDGQKVWESNIRKADQGGIDN